MPMVEHYAIHRRAAGKVTRREELKKFFNMEKMGIPIGAIRHKMTMDRIAEKDIKIFCREHAAPQVMASKNAIWIPKKGYGSAKKMEERREAMKQEENIRNTLK